MGRSAVAEPPAVHRPRERGTVAAGPDTGTAGRRRRWGILGGGVLGLTLAHRLARQGDQVTVFEAADRLGGLASAWRLGEVIWDRHYHVTLLSDARLRGLLRELGLEAEMEWVVTRTGCWADGELYSVSNSLELLRFPVLSPLDKLRLALTILRCSHIRNPRPLEEVPVADWLRRWSGRRAFERFWLPLLRSKLGEAYQRTNATFIWATIARLYAARRSGLKREMFGYVPGGYARIFQRFAQILRQEGVRIELGRPVQRVESEGGNGLRLLFPDGGGERFDRVAVTLAAPLAARLCPGLADEEKRRLAGIDYVGIVCASVLLEEPLAGYYITNLLADQVPFTGVIEMSAFVDRRYFGGCSLVYLPRYAAEDDPFFALADEEVEERFLSALERLYPRFRRQDVLAFRVSRVRQVFALPTLGYSRNKLPPVETSVPGLYLVGSAQIPSGILNVNATIGLAERALERIAAGRVHAGGGE